MRTCHAFWPRSRYLAGAAAATAQPSTPPAKAALPSIETKTAGMQKLDGFLPLYWDEAEGRSTWRSRRFGVEMLHSNGFAAGLGSNDIGLDRGALAGSRIVTFERVGPEGADGPAELRLPRELDEPRGGASGARRLRALGAVGLHGRGRDRRPRAGRRDRVAACATT